MTKAITFTYSVAMEHRLHIIRALMAGCMFLAILYAVNVYAVISRTVALQRLNVESATLGSSVDKLDTQYLALENKVSIDSLSTYGMSQGKVSEYITRSSSQGSVAFRQLMERP